MSQETLLYLRQPGELLLALDEWQFRMAADRAGGRTGSIEQHGSEEGTGGKGQDVGEGECGFARQAIEILPYTSHARRRLVDRRHARATRSELGRLAARRSTEIKDGLACDISQKSHRQSGGRIL